MKKLALSVVSLCITIAVAAQPILTGANTNPLAGEIFYSHYCDTTGISKGASGPGVTWNLSHLAELSADTAQYLACSATPYCDSFPGSTLSVDEGYDDYEYYITDAVKFAISGDGQSEGKVYYSDPINIVMYPMAYLTVAIDTYSYSQPAYALYSYGVDTIKADAYGTLMLPSGTYTNVLRVDLVSISTDSIFMGSTAEVDRSRQDIYFWYSPGFHNPILTMVYDTTGSGDGTSLLTDVSYTTGAISNEVEQPNTPAGIQVYPNPVKDNEYIKFYSLNNEDITISATDMMGRAMGEIVNKDIKPGMNEMTYPVSSLPPGIYMLHIQTGTNAEVKKIQVIR